ncbi:MAG: hypothetical protein SOW79_02670 [Prevotella sp.]|nr:hypothetical protein [Prevotella sp.]
MDVIHVKNISTPRFCIANIRADGEKAESARHLNRGEAAEQGKEQNRERSRTERGRGTEKGTEQSEAAETGKGAEQSEAAEAPHEQGRTKKSLKPDWEEAGRDSGRGLSQTI